MIRIFIAALLLAVTIGLAMADIEKGIAAYHAGDFETAHAEFSSAAQSGDPVGKHLLASLHYQGHGVPRDLKSAVALFEEAAALGYPPSQANLGLMYHIGDGVKRDIAKAIKFYKQAAENGDLQSAFNLGQLHRKGEGGVPIDYSKAVPYYEYAASRGFILAMVEYGLLFAQGQGVALDYVEAYAWMKLAAGAGDGQAAKNLAQLLEILKGNRLLEKAEQRAASVAAKLRVSESGG